MFAVLVFMFLCVYTSLVNSRLALNGGRKLPVTFIDTLNLLKITLDLFEIGMFIINKLIVDLYFQTGNKIINIWAYTLLDIKVCRSQIDTYCFCC